MTLMKRNRNQLWKPLGELETLQQEMNRLFDFSIGRWPESSGDFLDEGIWNPTIDILDAKDHLVVKADIPGITKDEIEVTVQDNNLILKGEKKHEEKSKDKNYIREERYYGSFYRSIPLPANVNSDQVKALYKNGVLELTLPKREDAKPKQINVEVK